MRNHREAWTLHQLELMTWGGLCSQQERKTDLEYDWGGRQGWTWVQRVSQHTVQKVHLGETAIGGNADLAQFNKY